MTGLSKTMSLIKLLDGVKARLLNDLDRNVMRGLDPHSPHADEEDWRIFCDTLCDELIGDSKQYDLHPYKVEEIKQSYLSEIFEHYDDIACWQPRKDM